MVYGHGQRIEQKSFNSFKGFITATANYRDLVTMEVLKKVNRIVVEVCQCISVKETRRRGERERGARERGARGNRGEGGGFVAGVLSVVGFVSKVKDSK